MSRSVRLLTCLLGITFAFAFITTATIASDFSASDNSNKDLILKQLSKALNKVSRMNDLGAKDRFLEKIAVGYAQIGEFKQATEVAESISHGTNKVTAFIWIARQYDSAEDATGAEWSLARALAVSETITGKVDLSEALTDIAATYVALDYEQNVTGILAQSLFVAHQLKNSKMKARLFRDVANVYMTIGFSDQAQGIANQAATINLRRNNRK